MVALMPLSMLFEEILDLTLSLETLLALVNQNPSRWQSVIHQIANDASIYPQILQENINLQSRVELLESVDEQLVQVQNQGQQSIGKKHVYE